ncbi:MAG: ATP-binding cassette domain-containing protein [Fibrobacteria bacterium]|nr:ATP-binding cassette domain-containing protein [Fibrobacteria bacterium]
MALISFRDVSFRMLGVPLLDGVRFSLERGERVCLTGRNGTGKSTTMRLIIGEHEPDSGEIIRDAQTRVGYLPQDIPDLPGTVGEIVREGAAYHALEGEWKVDLETERWVERVGLDPDSDFAKLSGGQKRRVLLARALAGEPDLLLLDEPTNHLDIASIGWMEDVLLSSGVALLFVTHDRAFLRRVANRILELDRGRLFDWTCTYDQFLERKQAMLEAEEKAQAEFDKFLAAEEVWIRKGLKARRTRNEGRVRRLEALRRERSERRESQGTVQMKIETAEKSGRKVVDAEKVSFAWGDKPILANLTTTIQRGDKLAILGPNGAGKTTLIRVLLGDLQPQSGTVKLGTNLEILYFDQMRDQIDPESTLRDAIGEGRETITIGGKPRHVVTYLQEFLFPPEAGSKKVKGLSGGERNRLLLARLFTRPANVLVLDEPTNDLDAETLDLLEDLLVEFDGTVILVSHDRAFLDEVATTVLAIGEGGEVTEHVGGYSDWKRDMEGRRAREAERVAREEAASRKANPVRSENVATEAVPAARRKLSYKEQRELDALPDLIERLETEQAGLGEAMADPSFYRKPAPEIAAANARVVSLADEIAAAYARWEELGG